jgi:DNA-binding HxlR family transcriptional regulator
MDKIVGSSVVASPGRPSANDARDVCKLFKNLLEVLDNPRRIRILDSLATEAKTFDTLKTETSISTGSLHHHLGVLHREGLIGINESRPMTYYRTGLLDRVASMFRNSQTHPQQLDCNRCVDESEKVTS